MNQAFDPLPLAPSRLGRKARTGLRPRGALGPVLGFAAGVALPTALAAFYFYGVAADRYVTEFRYSVRGGAVMMQGEGGGMVGAGGLIFAGDSFVLTDYVASLQAIADVEAALPLRDMLAKDGGDPVRRFDRALPAERLLPYWESAVRPHFDAVTGVTTMEVALFDPADSLAVAEVLVRELSRIVDSLSAQARLEMLNYVWRTYDDAVRTLDEARVAIESFRRANRLISPEDEAERGSEVIAELTRKLTDQRIELSALLSRAPSSPRIDALRSQIAAIEAELLDEIGRRAEASADLGDAQTGASLPGQLSDYEELQNAYDIARDNYVNMLMLKQQAEANAALRQADLVVFVPPRAATLSTEPRRPLEILKAFGVSFALWLMLRIFLATLTTR